jgi:hypothetical protein
MNKSDLKSGMLVKIRTGTIHVVVLDSDIMYNHYRGTDILVHQDGWNPLAHYTDDLLSVEGHDNLDIVEVYSLAYGFTWSADLLTAQDLIWSRNA